MKPAFSRDLAVDEETLAPFRERVPPAVKEAFDQGIVHLGAGEYAKAELSFKRAIEPEGDATAPLTFMAAAFALSGHDREAASAWQTALVGGTDFPQIYQWLGDSAAALARLRRSARHFRGSGQQVADRRPLHQAARDALRDVRQRTRSRPHARALPRGASRTTAMPISTPCSGSTPCTPAARWSTTAPKT